jgi:hypothetical protein
MEGVWHGNLCFFLMVVRFMLCYAILSTIPTD